MRAYEQSLERGNTNLVLGSGFRFLPLFRRSVGTPAGPAGAPPPEAGRMAHAAFPPSGPAPGCPVRASRRRRTSLADCRPAPSKVSRRQTCRIFLRRLGCSSRSKVYALRRFRLPPNARWRHSLPRPMALRIAGVIWRSSALSLCGWCVANAKVRLFRPNPQLLMAGLTISIVAPAAGGRL